MHESSMKYRVPYADTDQMGVVYYGNYLRFFEMVRNEYFREINYKYSQMEDDGVMLPVVEAHIDYKNPALYDDELTFKVKLGHIKGCRIRMENEIINEEGKIICTGYTTHCFMCKTKRKPVGAPKPLLDKLTEKGIL
ncbi:MAG: acyl-CoA thioesterase [Lentisphaeraceae bacterium]|nr:acyl-CoA thioesterase [Lentisphaeraceae bacterium]